MVSIVKPKAIGTKCFDLLFFNWSLCLALLCLSSICLSCSKDPTSHQHRGTNAHNRSINHPTGSFFANGRIISQITRPLVRVKYNPSIKQEDKIALSNVTKSELESMLPLEFVWEDRGNTDGLIAIEIKHYNSSTSGDTGQNPSVVSYYFKAYSILDGKETLAFSSSFHFKDAPLTDNLLRVAEADKNAKIGITTWKDGLSVYSAAVRQTILEFEEARAAGFRRKVTFQ